MARLRVEEIQCTGPVTPEWEVAVERLAISLNRSCVAVIQLSGREAQTVEACLGVLQQQQQQPGSAPSSSCRSQLPTEVLQLPGLLSATYRPGGKDQGAAMSAAHSVLDHLGRACLSALCRSSHLRLRSDTFTPFLDDAPLPASVLGSSRLTVREHVNNFAQSPAVDGLQRQPGGAALFPDPQEENGDAGILSLIAAREAGVVCEPGALSAAGPRSMLQVRSAAGDWQAVPMGPGEVAVVLGHTAQRVTCGLVAPASRRVAGDPYASSGAGAGPRQQRQAACSSRRELAFELRLRPSAIPDLRPALEAAGHVIPARYSEPEPVSVRAMMTAFEALMSPPPRGGNTPASVENLAALHASAVLNSKENGKRSKRRSCVAKEDAQHAQQQTLQHAPAQQQQHGRVTRSGRSRRSGEGSAPAPGQAAIDANMECDEQQQQQITRGTAARRASGGPASSVDGGGQQPPCTAVKALAGAEAPRPLGPEPLLLLGDRTCTVLGSCLAESPGHCLGLAVRSFTGVQRWFYVSRSLPCGRVFESYCDRMGIGLGTVKFLLKGLRVFGSSTPEELGLADGAELTAVPESMDRLQQARELGPLFASIFDVDVQALGAAGGCPDGNTSADVSPNSSY